MLLSCSWGFFLCHDNIFRGNATTHPPNDIKLECVLVVIQCYCVEDVSGMPPVIMNRINMGLPLLSPNAEATVFHQTKINLCALCGARLMLPFNQYVLTSVLMG